MHLGLVLGQFGGNISGQDVEMGNEYQQNQKKLDIGRTCVTGPPAIMSTLFWNYRGLRDAHTIQILLDLV